MAEPTDADARAVLAGVRARLGCGPAASPAWQLAAVTAVRDALAHWHARGRSDQVAAMGALTDLTAEGFDESRR